MGGGTPSMLSPIQLQQIARTLHDHYDLSNLEEATLEANPEDLTEEYLSALLDMGLFNRLSIGVQSFHDEELKLLNRRHNAAQAVEAVYRASAMGFGNISIDLIYALPGQSKESWMDNLRQVAVLKVQHLSAYALTVEEDTMLARQIAQGKVSSATEETVLEQYEMLLLWASENGFGQYEISNFCRPGYRARHNSRYWNRTPYLGAGAAAHSFQGNCRRWNVADVRRYIEGLDRDEIPHDSEILTPKDAFNEYIMTALRTTEGIDKQQVPSAYRSRFMDKIRPFLAAGLLDDTRTHFRPTVRGLLQADGLATVLFEE